MKQIIQCPAAVYFLGGKYLIFIYNQKLFQITIYATNVVKTIKGIRNRWFNKSSFSSCSSKVEYSLTDFGSSVIPLLRSLHEWNKKNSKTISNRLNKNFEEKRIR